MTKSNHDSNHTAKLHQKKQYNREVVTMMRMVRYGVNNFTRNAWLTTAATAIMTVTLLIVFSMLVTRSILSSTIDQLRSQVDVSVYLASDITDQQAEVLRQKLLKLEDQVESVRYIDVNEARQIYIDQENPSAETLQAISDLPISPFPPSFRIQIADPNKIDGIEDLVKNDQDFQESINPDPRRAPSFAGEKRKAIDQIGSWATFSDRLGIIASSVFIAISMLIVFNTIRMAIFNRRDEIQMMKLIGADKRFIRGPFIVEATMYGTIAALIATSIGYAGVIAIADPLVDYGIVIDDTRQLLTSYSPLVLVAMVILGITIGSISSRLAVRRYLNL